MAFAPKRTVRPHTAAASSSLQRVASTSSLRASARRPTVDTSSRPGSPMDVAMASPPRNSPTASAGAAMMSPALTMVERQAQENDRRANTMSRMSGRALRRADPLTVSMTSLSPAATLSRQPKSPSSATSLALAASRRVRSSSPPPGTHVRPSTADFSGTATLSKYAVTPTPAVSETGHIAGYSGHIPGYCHVAGRPFSRASRRALVRDAVGLAIGEGVPSPPHAYPKIPSADKLQGHIPGYSGHVARLEENSVGTRYTAATEHCPGVDMAHNKGLMAKIGRKTLNARSVQLQAESNPTLAATLTRLQVA